MSAMREVFIIFWAMLANAAILGLQEGFSSVACNSTSCKEFEIKGHKIVLNYLENKQFTLWCGLNVSNDLISADDPALPAMPQPVTVEKAVFQSCLVPNGTYSNALKSLNVTVTKSLMLQLPADSKMEKRHLHGLQITDLEITAVDDANPPRPSFDYLSEMQGLVTLKLTNVVPEPEALMQLPTKLENLYFVGVNLPAAEHALRNGSNVALPWLERLHSLRNLYLEETSATAAKYPKTVALPRLNTLLNLTSLSLYHVPLNTDGSSEWFRGSAIKNLVVKSCGLTELPERMFQGTRILSIHLTYNNITSLASSLFSPLENSLLELDLSNNNLDGTQLQDAVSEKFISKLQILKVNENPLGSMCGGTSVFRSHQSSTKLPKTLRRLELSGTQAARICSDWINEDMELMYIDLSNNNIKYISHGDLEMKRNSYEMEPVQINLKNNPKIKFDMQRSDIEKCVNSSHKSDKFDIWKRAQVKLQLSYLSCKCNAYWLYRALTDCPSPLLQIEGKVLCFPAPTVIHESILDYKPEEFLCHYNEVCVPGSDCSCWKRRHDNATEVRCARILPQNPIWPPAAPGWPLALHVPPGSLTAVPPVTLVELHAPNNNITYIDHLPTTLRKLDVRNNSISHISLEAAKVLGGDDTASKKVFLAGNRLACECDDAPAFDLLKRVVHDWDTTICADNVNVSLKTKNEMCDSQLPSLLFGTLIPILIFIIAAIVLRLLLPQIRQCLFHHNLCISCIIRVKDNDNDPKKTHDYFLSYSNEDVEHVKVLKKGLEKLGYSTIDHSTDWLPGESVMEQISESVMCARRTLLFVTDSYAESKWALYEFYAAHRHAMECGTARVVIVRCNLHKAKKLPADLKTYLESHTYLDWEDPKFWHKLCLLMPPWGHEHRSVLLAARDMEPPNCKVWDKSLPLLQKF